jgi:hypothetical protein
MASSILKLYRGAEYVVYFLPKVKQFTLDLRYFDTDLNKGGLQRVHERPKRPVRRLLHGDQSGRIWNQLVWRDLHRQASVDLTAGASANSLCEAHGMGAVNESK